MTSSSTSGNPIIELLQHISQSNATLRREVASLHEEVTSLRQCGRTLSNTMLLHRENVAALYNEPKKTGTESRGSLFVGTTSIHSSPRNFGFPLFPKLPPELRVRIWKIACFNEPRVIKLRVSPPDELYCQANYPPPILHATFESRREALRWYKRRAVEFNERRVDESVRLINPTGFPQTYFNFDIDILYPVIDEYWTTAFDYHHWAHILVKSRTIRNFRRIAIVHKPQTEENWDARWEVASNYLVHPRSKIEEIVVVCGPRNWFDPELRLTWNHEKDYIRSNFDDTIIHTIEDVGDLVDKTSEHLNYSLGFYNTKWDGYYNLDDADSSSEDENEVPNQKPHVEDKTNNPAENNQARKKAEAVEPRKSIPKIRYVKFKGSGSQRSR